MHHVQAAFVLLCSPCTALVVNAAALSGAPRRSSSPVVMQVKGYFAIKDVLLVKRNEADVAAFHEKERTRWREVYDEEYVEAPQDFYPGDRVEVVADGSVKDISNAKGMQGVVAHFEFDDGYESCQTCSTSCPVTVLLEPERTPKHGTLTYFYPVRSRGEPVQLCIAYGGVDMDVELITFDEWEKRKGEKYPFLPYITQPDGSIMLETCVIMKHIGTLGGKFVVEDAQDELCKLANDSPVQQADPTFNLPDGGGRDKAGQPEYDEWFAAAGDVLKVYAEKLGDGPFFAGEKPGYAECFVWHNLDNCFGIDKAAFAAYVGAEAMGKLTAFYDAFAELPGVKEYLAERPRFEGTWGFPGSRAQP